MKALSIRQPWASLIVSGIKKVENRTRPTKYRGPLLIHAAAKYDSTGHAVLVGPDSRLLTRDEKLALIWGRAFYKTGGAIIGQADLVGCVQDHPSSWAEPGAWHWVLANAKAFDKPVSYPGRLGLFDAPEPTEAGLFKPHDKTTRRVCLTQEPCDVVITRPGFWGNPYRAHPARDVVSGMVTSWSVYGNDLMEAAIAHNPQEAAEASVRLFEAYARRTKKIMQYLPTLKGKRLGCFCPAGAPCHGDVLVKLVEEACGA